MKPAVSPSASPARQPIASSNLAPGHRASELPWRVGLALIIILMLACYILASNSYWVGDDFNYVRPKDWGTVLNLFNPVNRLVFRPVHWALWAALYALFGTAPLGWHLVHYAMHATNIIWAALLMRQITGRKDLALLAAAFFAIQPAHPETVTWTGGQADLVFAFFWLPALWLWVRWRQGGGRRLWLIAGLLGFISMFGKEAALTLPIMSLWIDLIFGRDWLRWPGKRGAGWWRDWRLYARLLLDHSLFIAASGIYAGMRLFLVLIGHGGLMYGSAQLGFFSHPLAVLTGYTILSIGPWWVPSTVYDWPIWLQLSVVLVAAALVVAAIRWVGRVALFAVGWMGISLMLTLQAVANRWFYLPAVGLGLLLACVWIKFR
ncbi:MAG: glycosyltransferase family 39 protein, partial [Chloroflexi bacterium]|nr:glycosyltransferase family 39 protein [Chloroflexota bacterium]